MNEPRDTVRCPECSPLDGREQAECTRCGTLGFVPACAECLVLPREPMHAPCCGPVCREAWERRQPQPLVRRAP